jgi:hypothetical protein
MTSGRCNTGCVQGHEGRSTAGASITNTTCYAFMGDTSNTLLPRSYKRNKKLDKNIR